MGAYRGKIDELPGFAKATPWQASFDRQIVELGGCAANSVDYSTVPAPVFASRCARLLPASLRYAETGRRGRPRLKARAVAESKFNYLAA